MFLASWLCGTTIEIVAIVVFVSCETLFNSSRNKAEYSLGDLTRYTQRYSTEICYMKIDL